MLRLCIFAHRHTNSVLQYCNFPNLKIQYIAKKLLHHLIKSTCILSTKCNYATFGTICYRPMTMTGIYAVKIGIKYTGAPEWYATATQISLTLQYI